MADIYHSGIYAIVNNTTGRMYIGMTRQGINNRWGQHRFDLRQRQHSCAALQREWNIYGCEAFSIVVLEVISCRYKADFFAEREEYHMRNTDPSILINMDAVARRRVR